MSGQHTPASTSPSSAARTPERTAAIALSVLVVAGLLYGVAETAVRVAQLFT